MFGNGPHMTNLENFWTRPAQFTCLKRGSSRASVRCWLLQRVHDEQLSVPDHRHGRVQRTRESNQLPRTRPGVHHSEVDTPWWRHALPGLSHEHHVSIVPLFHTIFPSYYNIYLRHSLGGGNVCRGLLWSPYGIIFSSCFFLLLLSFFPHLISAVGDWMFTKYTLAHGVVLVRI